MAFVRSLLRIHPPARTLSLWPSTARGFASKKRKRGQGRGASKASGSRAGRYAKAAESVEAATTAPGRVLLRSRVGTLAEYLVAVLLGTLTGVYIFNDSFRVLGRGSGGGGEGIDPSEISSGAGASIRTGPYTRERS